MCKCAAKINEKLKPYNYALAGNLLEENPPAIIEILKIETRKRTPSTSLVASFCPFCGKKYPLRKSKGILKGVSASRPRGNTP